MLSDANLSEDIRNSATLRQYTGKFDCLKDILNKTYPPFDAPEPAVAG